MEETRVREEEAANQINLVNNVSKDLNTKVGAAQAQFDSLVTALKETHQKCSDIIDTLASDATQKWE